jgi:hypothetical protein
MILCGPGFSTGFGGQSGPGPGAAIRGAPKLITRPGNGRSGVNMELSTAMNRLLIAGIVIISTAPLCATSTAERRQVEGGRAKGCQHYQWR